MIKLKKWPKQRLMTGFKRTVDDQTTQTVCYGLSSSHYLTTRRTYWSGSGSLSYKYWNPQGVINIRYCPAVTLGQFAPGNVFNMRAGWLDSGLWATGIKAHSIAPGPVTPPILPTPPLHHQPSPPQMIFRDGLNSLSFLLLVNKTRQNI